MTAKNWFVAAGGFGGVAALLLALKTVFFPGGTEQTNGTQTDTPMATCMQYDGRYDGVRGYDKPKSGCPRRTTFPVSVKNCDISFVSDVSWSGKIDSNGYVSIIGRSRTGKQLDINGHLSNASMYSQHCEEGFFRMTK